MNNIFTVKDKSGKRIRLTKERWNYISIRHPDISNLIAIKEAIQKPTSIRTSDKDDHVKWFYRFDKKEKLYLLVSIKYLNGEGFNYSSPYKENKRKKMTKMNIYFDEEGDFLEIGFGEPRASYSEYKENDMFEMRDKETDEIIGYSFYNVSKRTEKPPRSIEVDLPKAVSQ